MDHRIDPDHFPFLVGLFPDCPIFHFVNPDAVRQKHYHPVRVTVNRGLGPIFHCNMQHSYELVGKELFELDGSHFERVSV